MAGSLESHQSRERLAMIIVAESATALKGGIAKTPWSASDRRMVLAFLPHRGDELFAGGGEHHGGVDSSERADAVWASSPL